VAATAWAQQAAAPAGPSAVLQLLPFALVFVIFYVLVLRPEQRKRQAHEQMLKAIKRNDAVVLTGGIHGRVTAIADDVLTVEIAPKVAVQVDRAAVQRVQGDNGTEAREKERQRS
jgi:preprotein translocase subunit YajC